MIRMQIRRKKAEGLRRLALNAQRARRSFSRAKLPKTGAPSSLIAPIFAAQLSVERSRGTLRSSRFSLRNDREQQQVSREDNKVMRMQYESEKSRNPRQTALNAQRARRSFSRAKLPRTP